MKVTFTFNLPEETEEANVFQNATDYLDALKEIYSNCREVWKHEQNPSEDKLAFAQHIAHIVGEVIE